MIQLVSASRKRRNNFFQTELSIRNLEIPAEIRLTGEISMQHVDFTYAHTGVHAIKNFNLHIRPGEQVAIVGRTGSGKTTIAQLLMRMFDVDGGTIKFDGKEIREFTLDHL